MVIWIKQGVGGRLKSGEGTVRKEEVYYCPLCLPNTRQNRYKWFTAHRIRGEGVSTLMTRALGPEPRLLPDPTLGPRLKCSSEILEGHIEKTFFFFFYK